MKKFLITALLLLPIVAFADSECPKDGSVSLLAGVDKSNDDQIPVLGVGLQYGERCLGVGGLQLAFGAALVVEQSFDQDKPRLDIQSVAAGPSWCLLLPTGTDACVAYMVRDTVVKYEGKTTEYGSVTPTYGVRQNIGNFALSLSARRNEYPTGNTDTFLVGFGYTPPAK